MIFGQTATVGLLGGGGEEVVVLNLNDAHIALLPAGGFLLRVVNLSQLLDLLLEFCGEEVGKNQQTTGQSWHHQNLTSSEKKVLFIGRELSILGFLHDESCL